MLQPWQTGKVIRIQEETITTRRFWIELPQLGEFAFQPGQFVTLDLPVSEKPAKRLRSYSIASWPDGSNVFELVIVYLEGGAGTNYLFNQVREGSELTVRGPQGVFVLPRPIDKDLFLICTGTGIAPFRSMVHHIYLHQLPHRQLYLIFGCRKFADALYHEELSRLQEKLAGFHYIPTYSREQPDSDHLGIKTGYVHGVYEEICLQRRKSEGQDPSLLPPAAGFFLCGWKEMINEAKKKIQDLGYDRKAIHQELYG